MPHDQQARRRSALLESLETRLQFTDVAQYGLRVGYSPNLNLSPTLNFSGESERSNHQWDDGEEPAPGVGGSSYSMAFSGRLYPNDTGSTRFYVRTDGGVRVWVDHKLIVDSWTTFNKVRDLKGSINLTQGEQVPFLVEYAHDRGDATIDVKWQTDSTGKQRIPQANLRPAETVAQEALDYRVDTALAHAKQSVLQTDADLNPGAFPDRVNPKTGKWQTTSASSWVSGYYGGTLWELNKAVGGLQKQATAWSTPLASTASLSGDHFGRIWATYKPLYDATGSKAYRDVLLKAANSKASTWSKKVKAFQTRDITSSGKNSHANFGVLMDQAMDMEMLLWAAEQTGNAELRGRVIQHMKTVAKYMVRSDGSIVQRGFFDGKTGALVSLENYQGLNHNSTWSRGQAWAINSFSRVAELTGDETALSTAKRVAGYFLDHLPSDNIPYWDFAADGNPKVNQARDSSAAAIATVGLYRLSKLDHEPADKQFDGQTSLPYRSAANRILSSLTSANNMVYGQKKPTRGILAKGSSNVPKNTGIEVAQTYGDYYLIQAINAYRG